MIKEFQSSSSLFDYITRIMPEWGHALNGRQTHRNAAEAVASAKLLDLWNKHGSKNGISRPPEFPLSDLNLMRECGLVREIGDRLEVTSKGGEALRKMILGDDRSIYDERVRIAQVRDSRENGGNEISGTVAEVMQQCMRYPPNVKCIMTVSGHEEDEFEGELSEAIKLLKIHGTDKQSVVSLFLTVPVLASKSNWWRRCAR